MQIMTLERFLRANPLCHKEVQPADGGAIRTAWLIELKISSFQTSSARNFRVSKIGSFTSSKSRSRLSICIRRLYKYILSSKSFLHPFLISEHQLLASEKCIFFGPYAIHYLHTECVCAWNRKKQPSLIVVHNFISNCKNSMILRWYKIW